MIKNITYFLLFLFIYMMGVSTISAQMSKDLVKVEPALPVDNSDGEPDLIPFKERLKILIEENATFLDIETSKEEIARLLRTSPSVISSVVNSEYGQDYDSYINSRRVESAIDLFNHADFEDLDYKDKDAVEIAARDIANRCGFKSTAQLYKQFKKQEGMKLGDYLSKYQKDRSK